MTSRMNSDVNDTAFVLGHGARHGSWQWAATRHAPAGAGAARVAAGLPGHGFGAPPPGGGCPLPGRAGPLTGRPQPADVTMGDCADGVRDTLRRARRHGRLVLVAHRAGGGPASPAAPCAPGLLDRIACLSASVPAGRPCLSGHLGAPENATAREQNVNTGDPQTLDAGRIDPLAPDGAYLEELRQTQCHDAPAGRFDRRRSALSPGLPPAVPSARVALAAARWGRMRRVFLRCARDRALPTAAQDLMTAEAGQAAVPGAPLTVRTLPTGHSPIAARPRELAGALVR